jgi:molecular chaperone DnaK (HSP70)
MQRFGLDFGTTNSSLTWAREDGEVVFCDLDLRAPSPRVLRSLLYFSLEERGFVVGQRAIDE